MATSSHSLSSATPRRLFFCCLIGAVYVGAAIAYTDPVEPVPEYVARYVVFTAIPKNPGAVKDGPVFPDLVKGIAQPLGAKPAEFLNILRKQRPDYELSPVLSGQVPVERRAACIIRDGTRGDAAKTYHVEDILLLQPGETDQERRYRRWGWARFPGAGTIGWDTLAHPENVLRLGVTQSMGELGDPQQKGRAVIYAWCVLPGTAAQEK